MSLNEAMERIFSLFISFSAQYSASLKFRPNVWFQNDINEFIFAADFYVIFLKFTSTKLYFKIEKKRACTSITHAYAQFEYVIVFGFGVKSIGFYD